MPIEQDYETAGEQPETPEQRAVRQVDAAVEHFGSPHAIEQDELSERTVAIPDEYLNTIADVLEMLADQSHFAAIIPGDVALRGAAKSFRSFKPFHAELTKRKAATAN